MYPSQMYSINPPPLTSFPRPTTQKILITNAFRVSAGSFLTDILPEIRSKHKISRKIPVNTTSGVQYIVPNVRDSVVVKEEEK